MQCVGFAKEIPEKRDTYSSIGVVISAAVCLKLIRNIFAVDGAVRSDMLKKRHPCHSLSCIPGKGLWPDAGVFRLEF